MHVACFGGRRRRHCLGQPQQYVVRQYALQALVSGTSSRVPPGAQHMQAIAHSLQPAQLLRRQAGAALQRGSDGTLCQAQRGGSHGSLWGHGAVQGQRDCLRAVYRACQAAAWLLHGGLQPPPLRSR
jgi:hypothetical protein